MIFDFVISQGMHDWVLFPAIIFLARMGDVSLGTLRGVLSAKGKKKITPFIGFFEVLIWLLAISQLMQNLSNFLCYFAWAGGYACGIFLGLTIEEKLAIGTQLIRIITSEDPEPLTGALREENRGYTVFDGAGARGPVKMIFTVVQRKEMEEIETLIEKHLPGAFYSIEDVKESEKTGYALSPKREHVFGKLFPVLSRKTKAF
jgi:uncharacterized protein YebE (UPF0316 family)